LLVHQFSLSEITGVTVMMAAILRLWPRLVNNGSVAYASFCDLSSRAAIESALSRKVTAVVGFNLHIEAQWELSKTLFALCATHGIPAYNYTFDYWPHHKTSVVYLARHCDVRLLASTSFVAGQMRNDGLVASVVPVGVPLPDRMLTSAVSHSSEAPVGSSGRLSPRKRFPDIVRAFTVAHGENQRLFLRLLPSLVFSPDDDRDQLSLVENEIRQGGVLGFVDIDRRAATEHDYSCYSTYICASAYEGFSMSPIEAAYYGCPALMSAIPPHRRIAEALFAGHAEDFLFEVGDIERLATLIREEWATGRRRRLLAEQQLSIRQQIERRWSLAQTVRGLAALGEARLRG
jgi:glycosyltransferase involved in cell wall biosynthesis